MRKFVEKRAKTIKNVRFLHRKKMYICGRKTKIDNYVFYWSDNRCCYVSHYWSVSPLVIKGEYYFGVRCWWVFALMGVAAVAASLMVEDVLWSTLLAVWGASSFWSIGELFEQRKRVEKGWFPKREK